MAVTIGGGPGGPPHVAIIMDGNGRWAQRQGKPRTFGHSAGAERVREIVKIAPELGVRILTLFAFSTENWHRPGYEVSVLMNLFRTHIVREVDELDQHGAEVRFIGDRSRLPADIQRLMTMMEERTRGGGRLIIQVAVSYGSRAEITDAVRKLAREVAEGCRDPASIDQAAISAALYTGGVPDPDLVIRTSGELRVSNFLLWQAAYAEFAFVDECWPDFTPERFAEVLASYGQRERRFGALRKSG